MGDRSFKINFGSDGTSRLREKVNEKLMEVMGDYMDDTLVEYVLVLLRNGRSKDEATRELNVFLGDDDSITFVSWLWDHLSLNLNLYAASKESPLEHERPSLTQEQACENFNSKLDKERDEFPKTSRSKEKTERKRSGQEISHSFPLRSTVTKILRSDDFKPDTRQSLSPKPRTARKRSLDDDQPMKREENGAARRLLQFAVRDAVKTVQQTNSKPVQPTISKPAQSTLSEPFPAVKRLRSVVSTSTDIRSTEEPQRLRSVALKAATEAAEDTTKKRYPRSVFDRISSGLEYNKVSMYDEDVSMFDGNTNIITGSLASDDRYINDGVSASSVYKPKDPLTLHYSVAQNANEVARDTRFIDQGVNYNRKDKSSGEIVNISVNVNTWKPPSYVAPRAVSKVESQMVVNNNIAAVTVGKTNAQLPRENNVATSEKEKVQTNVQHEQQKALSSTPGSYTANRPSDDSESRTVYVSNVHFAATKDALSRHFNKFGEVLKVIILNDPATGQPKGSAYVEFLRKESAESALSLNGTYFMSRGLKVVRKAESSEIPGRARVARAQPFASIGSRTAFPRGFNHAAFRGRLSIRPGARSLQWKREGPSAQTASTLNNVISPTSRNLTYVRPELKVDPSMGPA